MAAIKETATGRRRLLEPEHLVGRATMSALCLSHRYVSAQHAMLRFTGDRWEVKDLSSRNGTFVDGVRIKPGEERVIRVGSRVGFGKLEEEWELVDESPPVVMAVPLDGGDPIALDGDFITLPSKDDPRLTIYRDTEGAWVLEQEESIAPITNLQVFEVAGRAFRFSCGETIWKTSIAAPMRELEVRHLALLFSVSRNEEHVELQITCGSSTFDLGARSHHYLLLTLARQRLVDAAEGFPETSCGWIYQEDLAHDASMAGSQLNVDVFRIRQQFSAVGVLDAATIVERRPRTRQLRIGTGRLSVVVL
jgi:pSer/pThr/pTyr-binding forkhead associated (FHA) protein